MTNKPAAISKPAPKTKAQIQLIAVKLEGNGFRKTLTPYKELARMTAALAAKPNRVKDFIIRLSHFVRPLCGCQAIFHLASNLALFSIKSCW